jgi:hypothetical protein
VSRRNRRLRPRVDPPTERWSGGRRWRPEPEDEEPVAGRRKSDDRRRSRNVERDQPYYASPPPFVPQPPPAAVAKVCGRCRNFMLSDVPGGRGECDHPGSGFMYPYTDTPACPFFDGR